MLWVLVWRQVGDMTMIQNWEDQNVFELAAHAKWMMRTRAGINIP